MLGIWAVVAWRLHGGLYLTINAESGWRTNGKTPAATARTRFPRAKSVALRARVLARFWCDLDTVLRSLETWHVDLEVFLSSVWEQVQHRGTGAEAQSADDPAGATTQSVIAWLGWDRCVVRDRVFLVGQCNQGLLREETRMGPLKGDHRERSR